MVSDLVISVEISVSFKVTFKVTIMNLCVVAHTFGVEVWLLCVKRGFRAPSGRVEKLE